LSTSDCERRGRSASYGLWVPCNRINFFHTLEDRGLLDLHLEAQRKKLPWLHFGAGQNENLEIALDKPSPASSVIRRLLWVMQESGLVGEYRLKAGPIYRHPEKIDLKFAITVKAIYQLACERSIDMRIQRVAHGSNAGHDDELAELAEAQQESDVPLHLKVTFTAEGLQTWRATARTGANGADVDAALRVLQASLMAVSLLDLHPSTVAIRREAQAASATANRDPDVWLNSQYQGIMPFFQLNILLGGLFYPGFKPEIFFERNPTDDELEETDDRLSVRSRLLLDENGAVHDSVASDNRRHYEHRISMEYVLDALLCGLDRDGEEDNPEQALARTIDRFLTVTGDRALLPIKWRVERARRAILVAMLGVVHRKQHLTQMREEQPFPESFDAANEPQLRGYVTLLSAKLPLVSNVSSYLDPILVSRKAMGDERFRLVEALAGEWRLLLDAISTSVESLNQAIESAWQERVLYEQEQTRAEQEAMAEIERARVSASTRATTIDTLFGAMVLVFTIAAFSGDSSHSPTFRHDLSFIALGLAAVSLLWIFYRIRLNRRRRRGADQRHHYETNLRLDRHTTEERIGALLSLHSGYPQRSESPLAIQRRGSYRVERISDEEAMHKIHILSLAYLSPRGWRSLIGRRLKVPLSAIYEVLYHTPTLNGELLLREVRLTCYSDEVLTPDELRTLSEAVAVDLIDPFLEEPELFSDLVKAGADPSSALFKLQPR
jgi:hypothetical protein